ncbi:MAG TPA: mycofactocin precursor MftA [Chloroflexaceae bacterium]|nr:mycofactocin precursor MftA [Chloroflexaceae bacterium]
MALRLRSGRGTKRGAGAPSAPAGDAAEQQPALRERSAQAEVAQQQAEQPALLDEVLIEEVSIDGMCGVY